MGKASRRKREASAPIEAPAAPPAGAPPQGSGGWSRALAITVGAAALFRAAYFLQYRSESVFFGAPFLDARIYDAWARRIAAGEWSLAEPFYFAPGYPYALAIFYKLIASKVEAVYVVQFLFGLLNIILIHRLAVLAFGRRAGAAASGLAALYASFPFLETKVMSPTLALSLLLGSLLALVAAASKGGLPRWAASGILLGLTSLVRPETLLAAPFIFLWLWGWGSPRARGGSLLPALRASAALFAGWCAAIAPAAIHNVRAGGGSTLISSQGGITFYQSNNERARGLYVFLSKEGFSGAPERQAQEEKEIAEKALGRPLTRSEVSSYWFSRGLRFLRERPGKFLWLLGMKLLRFVGSYEYSTEYILYVERETVWLLWLPFVPFALIVALAVPAVVRAVMSGGRGPGAASLNAAGWLLLFTILANLASVLIFYVSSRYRLPSAPPLMAFAGCTIVALRDARRGGRRGDFYALTGVVAAVFLLAHFEKDSSATIQEANVHYNEGNIWSGKKEYERAVGEYRRALAMDDSRYETWYNMANALRDLRRPAEAAEAYARAAERRPQLWGALLRRAQALEETGDWAGARAAYEKAEAVHPDDFEIQLGIGRAAARTGDREAALRHLDRALEIQPGNQAAALERSRL